MYISGTDFRGGPSPVASTRFPIRARSSPTLLSFGNQTGTRDIQSRTRRAIARQRQLDGYTYCAIRGSCNEFFASKCQYKLFQSSPTRSYSDLGSLMDVLKIQTRFIPRHKFSFGTSLSYFDSSSMGARVRNTYRVCASAGF